MATNDLVKPLVVIVGPTASGKTALAIEVAKRFDGEIICADSRTIYKGMDIGTAKPTPQERQGVIHWGLDLVEPGERFTAADFKKYAIEKIAEIRARGHLPIMVGGTGLYVDAVIFDYTFGTDVDVELRHSLELLSITELHDYCRKNNINLPENSQNKRYVIRAIEQKSASTKRNHQPISNTIIVGIATETNKLRDRINARSEQMFDNGVVNEATLLGKKYGWDNEAMSANIYRLVHLYLLGVATLDEIKVKNTTKDWQLAKRQQTWLKRNPYIEWGTVTSLRDYLFRVLAN